MCGPGLEPVFIPGEADTSKESVSDKPYNLEESLKNVCYPPRLRLLIFLKRLKDDYFLVCNLFINCYFW